MPESAQQPDVLGFDAYEIRLSTRELRKHGMRVMLPPQAFRVLRMLVERPGQLISREEFRRALWPEDTFVDFDQGLNTAVKKIRNVLNDSAETPRYVETLPRSDIGLSGSRRFPKLLTRRGVQKMLLRMGAPKLIRLMSESKTRLKARELLRPR